jgi:predicted membrane-bound spermidine synthase
MMRRFVLGTSLLVIATGAGLLSLVALRWIGFLGLPPVVFLTLLAVGMPIGGLLLVRLRILAVRPLATIAMVSAFLSIAGALLFVLMVQWTRVSVDLSDAEIPSLALRMFPRYLATASAFFPLFLGYGLVEFAAYRSGLSGLGNRSGLVYALNLSGLLLAFGGYRFGLVTLGTSGLFFLGLALLFLAAFLLGPARRLTAIFALVFLCGLFIPKLESTVVNAIDAKIGQSTLNRWKAPPNEVVHDEWTPHCRLTVVDQGWGLSGFYDGLFYWFYPRNMPDPRTSPSVYRRLDLAFSLLIQPGDSVAVLGSGGGAQVAAALKSGAGKVYAVEVVPEVLEVLAGPLSARVEDTYRNPRAELVPRNARRFLDETDQTFDAIVLASVESNLGGFRDLFEPSQVLFTKEAFARMAEKLKPGGVLTVSKFTAVDRRGIIFRQCFRAAREAGLTVRGYIQMPSSGSPQPVGHQGIMAQAVHYLIVAHKGSSASDPLATLDNIYRGTRVRVVSDPPTAENLPDITDDRAFTTGLILANLGIGEMATGITGVGALLALLGLLIAWLIRRIDRMTPSGQNLGRLSRASIAVGFNFMVVEYLMVYRLMDRLDVPMDAAFLGMVAFTGLAAAGGLLLTRHSPRSILLSCVLIAAGMAVTGLAWPRASLVLVAAAAFLTGSLFPRLLSGPDRALVRVYVWDAYGALWGGLAALLVPLFLGFSGHQVLCACSLFLSGWAMFRVGSRPAGVTE